MFCTKCGKELPENSKFCKYCGNPVRQKMSLLERARNQDQEALAEIYNQSSSAVYRVIKVLIKDEDTVYDILQDTYVKAFTKLDQLQDENKLVPWMKMIANNTAKDWLKKCKPVLFTDMSGDNESDDLSFEESIEDERTDLNPEMAMDEKEVRRLVLEILDQLPEDQRLVVGMFYYEEMSVKDIASTLGVSDNTVKSRLSYGRKKVKELVLDLEKKGTKLYTVAPFTFFLYLLRRLESAPADTTEMGILQSAMVTCTKPSQTTGSAASSDAASSQSAQNNTVDSANTTNGTDMTKPTGTGRQTGGSTTGKATSTASKAGAKAAGAVGKTAAKTAARHLSMKVAAIALTGVIGAGGAYGVIKNADKLPFIHEQTSETDNGSSEEQMAAEAEPTETPEENTDVTETSEPTEAPDETDSTSDTEQPEEDTQTTDTENTEESQPESEQEQIPENVIADGEYGGNIHWYMGADGTLTVNGKGEIPSGNGEYPWYTYNEQITKVVIGEGITRIGDGAFGGYYYLKEISMSDTVKEIGQAAFWRQSSADLGITTSVKLSQNLEKIEEKAFEGADILSVELPDSVREIGDYAFHKCYNLRSITIGEKSHLEYVGCEAFEDSPFDSGTIYVPSTVQTVKSVAFGTGTFSDTVIFSDQLQELGLRAFGYGSTGLNTVYFMGDAPTISDDRIAIDENDAVFPETTTKVYYPAGNATWDGFDFRKLGINVTAEAYDPATLNVDTENNEEANEAEKTAKSSEAVDTEKSDEELYKEFYEKYVKDEKLQVMESGYTNVYHNPEENGYTDSMLLSAYMNDFGGDGQQELLLVRTREEKIDDPDPSGNPLFDDSRIERHVYLELYGMDDKDVTLRHMVEIPESNLNDSGAYHKFQIGTQNTENGFYLYCYDWGRASAGSGSAKNTFFKVTDKEFLQEHYMSYSSNATYQDWGWCEIDGTDYYTGNTENDFNLLNSILQQYGLSAFDEIANPDILSFNKDESWSDGSGTWTDTFLVQNCFTSSGQNSTETQTEAASSESSNEETGETLYYVTMLNNKEGGLSENGQFYMPGTVAVDYDGDTITFHGSFSCSSSDDIVYSKEQFIEYGVKSFELTPDTQYYTSEPDSDTEQSLNIYSDRADFLPLQLNGLMLTMKVTDGKIEYMRLTS